MNQPRSNNQNDAIKIAVISDLHVMAPELVINDGSALEDYLNRDRKMLHESYEILSTLVDEILRLKPDYTFVSGDLTKDGERVSHLMVAAQLHRLVDAGIQVLVIPGNHDINNPDAKIFDGDKTTPAETITRAEFAQIYQDMGYDEHSRRDPDTLSYCRDLSNGLTLLAIDACMDRLNTFVSRGDAQDHCKTSGQLEVGSQQWLVDQVTRATADGKRVIAMMHHHLVPHFHMEDTLAAPYMVSEAQSLRQRLIEAGLHVIFTGHLHISDICKSKCPTGDIVEIATAATVGYPSQWRMVSCNPATGKLLLHTRSITSLPSQPDFNDRARNIFVNCIPSIVRGILTRYWANIDQAIDNYRHKHDFISRFVHIPPTPDAIADLLLKHLQEPATKAYIAFVEGNEGGIDSAIIINDLLEGVNKVVEETVSGILKPVAKAVLHLRVYDIARLVLRSILEDRNDIGTPHESVINDHTAIIDL